MPSPVDVVYTPRFPIPDQIERNVDQTLELRVYLDGALVAPSACTVTLRNRNKVALVDGATATIASSYSTYVVTAATTADQSLGHGWRVEWACTISGQAYNFLNDASLVRSKLYPVVTDLDLFKRASALNPAGNTPITSLSNYQDFLSEAWTEIFNRLLGDGRWPNEIVTPSSLRMVHIYLTLAIIFEDLSTRLNEAYELRADGYRIEYERAWGNLNYLRDSDSDGMADDPDHRESAEGTVWLNSRGAQRWLR